MPYYFSLLFLVEFALVFLLWYLFIPKKQKNINATLGITLMLELSGIHTASALISKAKAAFRNQPHIIEGKTEGHRIIHLGRH